MYAKQSLSQMDGLLSKIDQEIASLEPGQKRFATTLLNQLRQAVQKDTLVNLRGVNASEIAGRMRELDTEFSHTISTLFETATAKQFQSVRKKGIRAIVRDEATRIPVDQLARTIVKLDSPQSIAELHKIVSQDTFNRVAAQVFNDVFDGAIMKTGENIGQFNLERFTRHLGVRGGNRRKAVSKLLELSGSGLKMKDLDELAKAGATIAGLEIPNVSSFIARRATIGGLQSLINGLIPGSAIVGSATYAGGPLLGAAVFIGGGRLVSAMLAKPETARALRKVLDKEATSIVKRKAFIQALRGGLLYMKDNNQLPDVPMIYAKLQDVVTMFVGTLDRHYESMKE